MEFVHVLENLMQNLNKLAECPICLERLRPPVTTCVEGHAICGKCRKNAPNQERQQVTGKNQKHLFGVSWNSSQSVSGSDFQPIKTESCPVCKQNISSNFNNVTLNQILDVIPLPCPNESNGCCEIMMRSDIAEHIAICDFQLVSCHCKHTEKFVSCELGKHLQSHPTITPITLSEPSVVRIEKSSSLLTTMVTTLYEENISAYFFWYSVTDWTQKLSYVGVQYVGRRKNAKKYIYEIRIDQGLSSLNKAYFTCTGACIPYVEITYPNSFYQNAITLDMKNIFLKEYYLVNGFQVQLTVKNVLYD